MNNVILVLKTIFPWLTVTDFWVIVSLYLVLDIALSIFVYNDSKSRGGHALSWALWCFVLGGILPFLFYLIVRSPYTLDEINEEEIEKEVVELQKKYYEIQIAKEVQICPVCGEEIKSDYMYCPYCFTQLKKRCPECGRSIDKDFKICPYCGHVFDEEKGVIE